MDINGGQTPTQTNGNPIWPGAVSTGPLIAGNVVHSNGLGVLAGLGEQIGVANQGYAVMAQFDGTITQAGSTSAYATQIVIPAQSMITDIRMFVTTAWTGGTTTFTIKDTAGNSYTSTGGGAGATIGSIVVAPPATKSVVQQWENVGSTDVQLTVTSGGTGSGVGTLMVKYIQGCNATQTG